MKNTKEQIEGIEFFDLMQAYRIAEPTNQDRVCKKFEGVKDWINEKFIKQNTEMHEALKKVQLQVGQLEHNWDYREKEYMPYVVKALKEIEK